MSGKFYNANTRQNAKNAYLPGERHFSPPIYKNLFKKIKYYFYFVNISYIHFKWNLLWTIEK